MMNTISKSLVWSGALAFSALAGEPTMHEAQRLRNCQLSDRPFQVCSLAIAWAVAQQSRSTADSASPPTETKVSESRKNGKYKRVTETFADKVLVARKEEVSVKDNGQIDYVFVKLFRAGEMTYSSTFYKSENRTIRSFYHQGKMSVEEGDEDGDNFFETMILFDAKEQPVEAFSKSKDGTVTQFTKEKLAELKKSFANFQE